MTEISKGSYGLYYRYGGGGAGGEEPLRRIHGPATKEECRRVRNARLVEIAGVAIESYAIRYIRPKRQSS